jgi:carbon storage regulator
MAPGREGGESFPLALSSVEIQVHQGSCGEAEPRSQAMLVLSRKPGEKIRIGDNVTVTIVRIGPNNVRLGIDAPRDLNIVREEICGRDPVLNHPHGAAGDPATIPS